MRFSFKRARKKENGAAAVQLRRAGAGGFEMLEGLTALGGGDVELYRAIREAVPIVDAAILKLIRLTGGFHVECANARAEKELAAFIREVDAGRGQRGLQSFLDMYLDSMLTCGRAVGEIVLGQDGREIAAVLCGNVRDVLAREGDTPLDFQLCARGAGGEAVPLPYQELLLFTPLNPEADSPCGVSLLRSMPFLTEILMKIFASMGANFERSGNVRYAVVYKPSGGEGRGADRLKQIAREWGRAMESTKSGEARDFVAMGDVEIKAIGADGQVLDSEAPVRQILEQLIAKTGIPPFMLGLSWSSTERMSSQQADMMTSELDALRRTLTPAVEKICRLWMDLHGYAEGIEVVWDEINLQDTVEQARAELYAAQAAELTKGEV